MLTVETIGKVRHAFLVKGRSIKRIARELHLARNTVRGTCLVRFDCNKYSVMAKAVGRPVDVHAYASHCRNAGR